MEFVQPFLFWVIAGLTGVSAVATVATQNIVRSATWLLFTLAGTSGIFFLLGADLVGAIQLLVYVGGTMVLVVFGVMLTAQGPFISMKTNGAEWAISAVAGLLLMAVLSISVLGIGRVGAPEGSVTALNAPKYLEHREPDPDKPGEMRVADPGMPADGFNQDAGNSRTTTTIGIGLLGVGVGPAHEQRVGNETSVIRTNYLFLFEIVSVHLLVVLIGAAYLARAKRRRREAVA